MSIFEKRIQPFTPSKDLELNWDGFNGGLNTYFKPTELKQNELSQADNLMLTGRGAPTGRWGSALYNKAGEAGRVRLLDAYYNSLTSVNYLLSITDSGYLTKKSGASYSIITGASFASGSNYQSVQLSNNTYFASATLPFVKFDGTNLIPYVGLGTPTNVSVAQLSAASGFTTWSWRVTATSNTGETLGSVFKVLASMPLDLTTTSIRVTWNTVSAASGVLTGYNIYRGFPGDETWLASGSPSDTAYIDTGIAPSDTIFPPNSDTTTGPRAKYIIKFEDRIILAGFADDPSKVMISARYPYNDRFTALDGGGYAYASPNDGDYITGLGIQNLQTVSPLVIIYKKNSTYVMSLETITLGNYSILDPHIHTLTSSNGSANGDTVVQVENDVYSFSTKGLYSTGQEPQFLNQIRTNEISSRIRPYVQNLSDTDFQEANAAYIDYKYILSFPSRRETMIYDRQRLAFMGPWKTPWGITKWFRYFDPSGVEKWVAGTDNAGNVYDFSPSYLSDAGTAIAKNLRTKKEDFGNWSIMKILKYFYFQFRNVKGSVTISLRIEERSGNTVTTKTATITSALGDGGWGSDQWGAISWGQSDATVVLSGDELVRFALIYKTMRVLQVEVTSSGANTNWEFLGVRATAQGLGPSSLPSSLKV